MATASWSAALLAISVSLSVAACAGAHDPTIQGTITVSGTNPRFGQWQISPTTCAAYAPGLELMDGAESVVIASAGFYTDGGTFVTVPTVDGSQALVLYPTDCRDLRVDIHDDGSGMNLADGYVVADCDLPGGGKLSASVSYDGCAWQ